MESGRTRRRRPRPLENGESPAAGLRSSEAFGDWPVRLRCHHNDGRTFSFPFPGFSHFSFLAFLLPFCGGGGWSFLLSSFRVGQRAKRGHRSSRRRVFSFIQSELLRMIMVASFLLKRGREPMSFLSLSLLCGSSVATLDSIIFFFKVFVSRSRKLCAGFYIDCHRSHWHHVKVLFLNEGIVSAFLLCGFFTEHEPLQRNRKERHILSRRQTTKSNVGSFVFFFPLSDGHFR